MQFRSKEQKLAVALLIMGAILFGAFFIAQAVGKGEFVRGRYGTKCYITGSEHGNIEYPIYFDTVDECLRSLYK